MSETVKKPTEEPITFTMKGVIEGTDISFTVKGPVEHGEKKVVSLTEAEIRRRDLEILASWLP